MRPCPVRNLLLEVLHAAIDGYLGPPLWFHPSAMRWFSDPSMRPETLSIAFTSNACDTLIDLTTHVFKKSIFITTEASAYRVVSALAPDAGPERAIVCMTEAREFLLLLRTTAARYEDGTVQIYGAEPNVSVLTPARLQRQLNNPLFARSGDGSSVYRQDA